jgi:hypothetical protein
MRKLLSAFLCVVFMAGVVVAAEVTLVKYDAKTKEVTVKDGDGKEATYKLTDKTKYVVTTKDGAKDVEYKDIEKGLTSDKSAGKMKMDITTDKDTITEVKVKRGGKKN